MDYKMVTRWGGSTRGDPDEDQRLLLAPESYPNGGGMSKSKPKIPKIRKAKREDSYSDDDELLIPLGGMSRPSRPPPVTHQSIEVDIQPGETLLSVALKYNIPVSELKRVNNLLTDNEFFALKRIKIPVKPSSLLTELLPSKSNNSENGWIIRRAETPETGCTSSTVPSSPNSETEAAGIEVDEEIGLVPLHSKPVSGSKNTKKAKYFLKNVDKDLQRIKEKQAALVIKNGPAIADPTADIPLPEIVSPKSNPRNGTVSVCGLVFVLLVIVAVVIILLFAKHETVELEEQHHHKNHTEKVHH